MSTAHLVVSPAVEVWDELSVGMLLCDGRGRLRAVNGCAARLLGLAGDDIRLTGLTDDLGTPVDLPVLAAQVLSAGTATTLAVAAGGRRLWLEVYPVMIAG